MLPAFIAFHLGATLLDQGAGLLQIAGFISALMGIGIVTFSMEKNFFGVKFTSIHITTGIIAYLIISIFMEKVLLKNKISEIYQRLSET